MALTRNKHTMRYICKLIWFARDKYKDLFLNNVHNKKTDGIIEIFIEPYTEVWKCDAETAKERISDILYMPQYINNPQVIACALGMSTAVLKCFGCEWKKRCDSGQ